MTEKLAKLKDGLGRRLECNGKVASGMTDNRWAAREILIEANNRVRGASKLPQKEDLPHELLH